jgi:hypothetical protein
VNRATSGLSSRSGIEDSRELQEARKKSQSKHMRLQEKHLKLQKKHFDLQKKLMKGRLQAARKRVKELEAAIESRDTQEQVTDQVYAEKLASMQRKLEKPKEAQEFAKHMVSPECRALIYSHAGQ